MNGLDLLACQLLPSENAVESRVGDETVLLHLGSGTYFGLDPIGTRLWEQIRLREPLAQVCAEIAADYAVDSDQVTDDARRFLADLVAHDIVAIAS